MDVYNQDFNKPYGQGNPQRVKPEQVNEYTLDNFGITIDAVKGQMFGTPVVDPVTGKALPDNYYKQAIKSAVGWAEKRFDISILPRFVVEEKDFNLNEANSYMYQKLLHRPVLQVEHFDVNLNGGGFINFPTRWWKVESLAGTLQIMPGFGTQYAMSGVGYGVLNGYNDLQVNNLLSYSLMPYGQSSSTAPQAFHVNYVAGMLPQAREGVEQAWELPTELLWVILKQAAKEVLQVFGRLILSPGIAAQSLTIDGITEQKTSTASAMYGGMQADIMQLDKDIAQYSAGLDAKFGPRISMI